MMTKHAPASPLPHIAVTDAYQIWDGSRSMVVGEFQLRGDCGYYAHAANAYPELVEALRDLQFFVRLGTLSEQEAAVNRARALLRTLGESDS